MTTPTDNPDWTSIADLRLCLHQHVHISPQMYRGVRWYVLRNRSSGQFLRVSTGTYEFVGRLNGENRVEDIWAHLDAKFPDPLLDKNEIILIVNQLRMLELVNDSGLNSREVINNIKRDNQSKVQRTLMNPLSIRIPLIDPDHILNRITPYLRPLFSPTAAIVWLLVVFFAVVLATINASSLSAAVNRDILAPGNLLLMMILFVAIKTVHEFAHALAVKMWGGEVHEMGITFLVFAPVPYVDASAAWEFRDKSKRIVVSAIGIVVELFVAAIALFVWLLVEPGLVQDMALNALLIGSVSTLLFNANPLLRFDGYYVLQDVLEIPNLYTRSGRYYVYLVQRYLFGLDHVPSPATATGESSWFAFYGLAAFLYRMTILLVIVLFLAKEYLFVGVAIAVWAVFMQLVLPVVRMSVFLAESPLLQGHRMRALSTSLLIVIGVCLGLVFVPINQVTQTEGMVWISEQAEHYAGTEGFVSEVFVESGNYIEAGTPVLQLSAPDLDAKIKKLRAKRREFSLQASAEFVESHGRSESINEKLRVLDSELALLEQQSDELLVRSKLSGTFILPSVEKIKGRFMRQGDFVGYIFDPAALVVKTVVAQSDIGLFRRNVENIEVRLAEHLGETIEMSVARETPSASNRLPSSALGTAGGGKIAIQRKDQRGTTASEELFQLELYMPEGFEAPRFGGRAYVRIDHGSKPLAAQWLHSGRQLLLSRLSM